MADFYITEYRNLGRDSTGNMIAAGFEPNVTEQQIANPVASTQSAALNEQTSFVMIHATAVGHILFGLSPTAVITKGRIGAGETRFYAVQAGQSMKIAAINGT